jgi:hypothetical protein
MAHAARVSRWCKPPTWGIGTTFPFSGGSTSRGTGEFRSRLKGGRVGPVRGHSNGFALERMEHLYTKKARKPCQELSHRRSPDGVQTTGCHGPERENEAERESTLVRRSPNLLGSFPLLHRIAPACTFSKHLCEVRGFLRFILFSANPCGWVLRRILRRARRILRPSCAIILACAKSGRGRTWNRTVANGCPTELVGISWPSDPAGGRLIRAWCLMARLSHRVRL